jgi:uncharacterized membrane protein YedE/YeeE
MNPRTRQILVLGACGLALGFCLTRIGFTDFGELHRMLTFQDPRLLLVFGGAVALSFAGFKLFARGKALPARPMHFGIVPGAVLFGIGWAVSGACPAVAMIQIGQGQIAALLTFAGMLAGSWAYPRVQARFFRRPVAPGC